MMNKIKSLIFLCIFLFSIYAVPSDIQALDGSVSTQSAKITYTLAWPGILPDSPLYKLKILRDIIVAKLVINPIKKIEYDLLLADKTIYASKLLFEKGKIDLSRKTALKGENFFTILVSDYKWASWRGNKIPSELDWKIEMAAKKHQEIFSNISSKIDSNDEKTFKITAEFSKRNYEEILRVKDQRLHPQK